MDGWDGVHGFRWVGNGIGSITTCIDGGSVGLEYHLSSYKVLF
jgi:hypothetical protein